MTEKLDPREQHFRFRGPSDRTLFLRHLPCIETRTTRRAVLYVHGATFPSALSVAYRIDGRSWRDALCDAGFDVWALDFQGFGESDRYLEMNQPPEANAPLCTAADAANQLSAAVRFILDHAGVEQLSLIAHSWGTMAAGLFAGNHPPLVDRIVFFAPIARRKRRRYEAPPRYPAWRIVTADDQWARFVEDVPPSAVPVAPGALEGKHRVARRKRCGTGSGLNGVAHGSPTSVFSRPRLHPRRNLRTRPRPAYRCRRTGVHAAIRASADISARSSS